MPIKMASALQLYNRKPELSENELEILIKRS